MSKSRNSAEVGYFRQSALNSSLLLLSLVLPPCWWYSAIAQQHPEATKRPAADNRGAPPSQGQHNFETRCSACHGLDGRGGEHAPNIATNPAVRQLDDREVFRIVHDGIAAKGMPAFEYLPERQIKSIVSYLRFLAGPSGVGFSRGNAARGQDLFFGKAGCSGCHIVPGKGGFLGADLSEYRTTDAHGDAKEAFLIVEQFYALHQSALNKASVEVITRQGVRLTGVVRNEDNFSLQLLGRDGTFHLLMKSDLERVNRNANVFPSTDLATRLSSRELEDLLRYVAQGMDGTESGSKNSNPKRSIGAAPKRSSPKKSQDE